MHLAVYKDNYFKSFDVSIMEHGCVDSQFTLLYNKDLKLILLTHPYFGSYERDQVNISLRGKWLLELKN